MAKKQNEERTETFVGESPEETVNVRHTITAEETFTLAKDVFDIRCFIKNVYANRAVIERRLNIVTLSLSAIFTLLYTAYVLFISFSRTLNLQFELAMYILLGVYLALFITMVIIALCGNRAGTKGVKRLKTTLKVFKILIRLMSIGISIVAMVTSASGGQLEANHVALQILIVVFSIITLVVQIIPLLFGGIGKMVRWLLSPVKIKHRFSTVILEWYELAVSGTADKGSAKKVSSRYFDDIGALIDNQLIPALGKKYITAIRPSTLINVTARATEENKPVLEGILKSVFAYAAECGYVAFDPCKDLNWEGSVEEEEKPKPNIKNRLLNVGKKIGKSVLEKYITSSTEKK